MADITEPFEQLYPQHAKLDKIKDTSQAIGFFLEWLQGEHVSLMRWETVAVDEYECRDRHCVEGKWNDDPFSWHVACKGTGYIPIFGEEWMPERRDITHLLADYFKIDYAELQDEKDRMLADIRKATEET